MRKRKRKRAVAGVGGRGGKIGTGKEEEKRENGGAHGVLCCLVEPSRIVGLFASTGYERARVGYSWFRRGEWRHYIFLRTVNLRSMVAAGRAAAKRSRAVYLSATAP